MSIFWRLMLGFALLVTPSGCSLYQAYAQRQAIAHAQFNLKSVGLGGIDLAGANLEVVLELVNPTETPIVLDRLDYTLYVNDRRAIGGFSDQRLTVPPREVRPFRLLAFVRYADLTAQLRGVLQQGLGSYRLEGVGHFDTPVGTIDYPIRLLGQG